MIRFQTKLERTLTNHILQTFIPSMMLCSASTGSLFIPQNIVPGRMGLSVTSLLSLISLLNGARNNWTKTSYLRAIDVWTVCCYLGLFYTLIEYSIILALTKGEKMDLKTQIIPDPQERKKKIAMKIEEISKLLLPLYNIVFFTVYFIVCLLLS